MKSGRISHFRNDRCREETDRVKRQWEVDGASGNQCDRHGFTDGTSGSQNDRSCNTGSGRWKCHPEDRLDPGSTHGQRGGIKEGLVQTSFGCLIERLCDEGEVRDPDTEKVQEAEDRQELPFCFWKWTVNEGLDSIWGNSSLLMGYGEPQLGDICLGYLGLRLGYLITPGS